MIRRSPKKPNPHKSPRDFQGFAKFLIIAVILLFLADHFILGGERSYVEKIKRNYYAGQAEKQAQKQIEAQKAIDALLPPQVVYPDDGAEYFEAPPEIQEEGAFETEPLLEKTLEPVLPKKHTGQKAKIAIVIDDVGMNLSQSRAAINLPSEVTLALLPYAETVRPLAREADQQGHELIIHTPMEALNGEMNLGSMALLSEMDFAEFEAEFRKITGSFEGYVGVNNHMGSKLTQDPEAMGYLMDLLKQEGLYFLDSKTIHTSVAAKMAQAYDIPYAERDVFLDHEQTPEFIAKAFRNLERIAREQGQAIAIGHPKEITLQALREWIPTLADKGYELVPLSALMILPRSSAKTSSR